MKNKITNWVNKNKKIVTNILAISILLLMFLMAFFSSRGIWGDPGDSGTMDEIAHIPAGFTYVHDLDYRLNPEHPPLVKALSGLFLNLDQRIKGPEADKSWLNSEQWDSGWYMLYSAGNDPAQILRLARLPIMLVMIILGFFLFRYACKLFGRKVGLIVLILYAFYPDILAHGRLVTTDVASALGFVLGIYYFDRALQVNNRKNIILAGIFLGLAQLFKFSAILLLPIFFILIMIKAFLDRGVNASFKQLFWQNFKILIQSFIISLSFIWLAYMPFTWNMTPALEHKVIESNIVGQESLTVSYKNFIHKFENNRITRPLGHYILGVSLVVGRVEGGNDTFILGHQSDKSIKWFFPVAWLLKTPISIILLLLFSITMLFVRKPKTYQDRWTLALILTPLFVYWAITLQGSLNLGIRHLMPTIPFVLLFIGYTLRPIVTNTGRLLIKIVIAVLIVFMIFSSLRNFPNYIAYFNEFTPRDVRYTRLIDSSLDWGQDLLRLKKYLDSNNIKDIKIDYFGGSSVPFYIPTATKWQSSNGPTTGWLAVSATYYQSSKLSGIKERKWSYEWLDKYQPVKIIGGSILIFNISEKDLRDNPPVPSYKIIQK
ncbi:MAG: glycosyltransferase family 39 protein [bacterium]